MNWVDIMILVLVLGNAVVEDFERRFFRKIIEGHLVTTTVYPLQQGLA